MFRIGLLAFAALVTSTSATAQNELPLQVGLTGGTSASGTQNPTNLMRNRAMQELMLEAAAGPVTVDRIEQALAAAENGATLDDLLHVGALRSDGETYALNFNLFTIADQLHLDDLSVRYGASLADAVLARRDDIDAALADYDVESVDSAALAYILVGCFALDWDGLAVTAERGWRVGGETRANGDVYTLWARQRGPEVSVARYYWGSHNSAHDGITFTTFGDHAAVPRHGFPDLTWQVSSAIYGLDTNRDIRMAAIDAVRPHMQNAMVNAGRVMFALRDGPLSRDELAGAENFEDGLDAAIRLLDAMEYVSENAEGQLVAEAVVLTERDYDMVTAVRSILQEVMNDWLADNYAEFRNDAGVLTPLRSNVPYETTFTQLWHYIFGAANRELVERGYFADPYAEETTLQGFLPVVWHSGLTGELP